jgi:hypothetical protein
MRDSIKLLLKPEKFHGSFGFLDATKVEAEITQSRKLYKNGEHVATYDAPSRKLTIKSRRDSGLISELEEAHAKINSKNCTKGAD